MTEPAGLEYPPELVSNTSISVYRQDGLMGSTTLRVEITTDKPEHAAALFDQATSYLREPGPIDVKVVGPAADDHTTIGDLR